MIFTAAALSFARGEDERLLLTHISCYLCFSRHAAFTLGDLFVGIKMSQGAIIGREHGLVVRIRDWEPPALPLFAERPAASYLTRLPHSSPPTCKQHLPDPKCRGSI